MLILGLRLRRKWGFRRNWRLAGRTEGWRTGRVPVPPMGNELSLEDRLPLVRLLEEGSACHFDGEESISLRVLSRRKCLGRAKPPRTHCALPLCLLPIPPTPPPSPLAHVRP